MALLQDYMVAVTVGICLCVGYVIKHLIPSDKVNRLIPLVVTVVGAVVNLWANSWYMTPAVLLEGMVSGLASTGMYESLRPRK